MQAEKNNTSYFCRWVNRENKSKRILYVCIYIYIYIYISILRKARSTHRSFRRWVRRSTKNLRNDNYGQFSFVSSVGLLVWGFKYDFTDYDFRKALVLLKTYLARGVNVRNIIWYYDVISWYGSTILFVYYFTIT